MGLLRVDYYPSLTEKQLRPLPVMKPLPMFGQEDVLKVYRLYHVQQEDVLKVYRLYHVQCQPRRCCEGLQVVSAL